MQDFRNFVLPVKSRVKSGKIMWHAPYQALSYFLRQRKPVDPVTVTARLQPAFSCHNKLNCKAAPAAINRLGALKLTVTVRCSAPADVEQRPVHHLPSVLPATPCNSSAQRRLLTLRCRQLQPVLSKPSPCSPQPLSAAAGTACRQGIPAPAPGLPPSACIL